MTLELGCLEDIGWLQELIITFLSRKI